MCNHFLLTVLQRNNVQMMDFSSRSDEANEHVCSLIYANKHTNDFGHEFFCIINTNVMLLIVILRKLGGQQSFKCWSF